MLLALLLWWRHLGGILVWFFGEEISNGDRKYPRLWSMIYAQSLQLLLTKKEGKWCAWFGRPPPRFQRRRERFSGHFPPHGGGEENEDFFRRRLFMTLELFMFIMGSSFIAYSSVGRVVFPPWPSKVFWVFFPTQKNHTKVRGGKNPNPWKLTCLELAHFSRSATGCRVTPNHPTRYGWMESVKTFGGKICKRRVEYVITSILIQNRFIRGTFFERGFSLNWHWHRGHKSDLSVSIWNVRLSLICLIFLREKFWEAKKRVLVEMRNARNGD